MSKIALDEGVPEQIALHLSNHNVWSVRELQLKGTKNGELLDAIEARGFEVFVSNDKKLEFDQNVSRRPFSVVLLSTNHWPTIQPNVYKISAAVETAAPGVVTKVDCGRFLRRKLRNTSQ